MLWTLTGMPSRIKCRIASQILERVIERLADFGQAKTAQASQFSDAFHFFALYYSVLLCISLYFWRSAIMRLLPRMLIAWLPFEFVGQRPVAVYKGGMSALRACFENRSGEGLRARRGGWRGSPQERAALVCSDSTRAHLRENSVTEEQRSQPPRPAARPPDIFSKHALSVTRLGGCESSRPWGLGGYP
jgi:hypothetical protein